MKSPYAWSWSWSWLRLSWWWMVGGLVLCVEAGQVTLDGHTFTLPEGFTIERVAGPPLVDRPVSASFDSQGRLYVTDSSGSNEKPEKQLENPTHRVVRLEDVDGDGRYDKTLVVAERLMFPEGCLWHEGALYIGAPPSIWKLTDADGDGVAEQREEWFKQGVLTGCANDVHGPYLGPDGWLYWTKGAFAKLGLKAGDGRPIQDRCAHIFRRRPDGTGLESVMAGGMDNPVEVDFTAHGEPIFTSTFIDLSGPGKRDGLAHAVYGGVFPKVNDVTDEVKRTGELLPAMTHFGPGAPSGFCRYRGGEFGAESQDAFFATLFNLHKVTRHTLVAKGATYQTVDTDFVVSDNPDFHPTDVLEDADGSLLIVDTGGWYKLCCPTSQLAKPDVLGAIYRVRRVGAPRPADAWGRQVVWDRMSVTELVKALGHERWAQRAEAARRLEQRAMEVVGEVTAAALEGSSPVQRNEAAWWLVRVGGESGRAALRRLLRAGDTGVVRVALKGLALLRDGAAAEAVRGFLRHDDPAVVRLAAEALGRMRDPGAIPGLLEAAGRAAQDRFLEHSLIYALIEIGDSAATAPGLSSPVGGARRAALIALDQMDGGGLKPADVLGYLSHRDVVLREAARWIVGRHSEWGADLAAHYRELLTNGKYARAQWEEMSRQLGRLARNEAIQYLVADIARGAVSREDSRIVSFDAMARAGLREAPAIWLQCLAHSIPNAREAVLASAVAAARALPMPKDGHAGVRKALLGVGMDVKQPAPLRLDALAAAGGVLSNAPPALFGFLLEELHPEKRVRQRSAAASVISRMQLTGEQLNQLTAAVAVAGPMEIASLLGPFERATDEATGLALVAALKQSKAASAVRPEVLRGRLAGYPENVRREAEAFLATLDAGEAQQKERLERLLAGLKDGDVRRGQAIFNSTKAACSTCHAMGYLGGKAGPDLTSIGQVRTERDLLESIVFPSASFVRSYEPVLVATRGGEEYSGVLKHDGTEEVLLVTGPESEMRVAKADITDMRPGRLSMMPQGLDEQLSHQELADLVAFLKNTKWGAQ